MDINSQVSQMTTKEKLRTMELLWTDLCQTSDFSSPEWHNDILDERERRIENGEEKILDWRESKERLRTSLR